VSGNFSTQLVLTTDADGQENLEATLVGAGVPAAELDVSPSAIDRHVHPDEPEMNATVILTNEGGIDMYYNVRLEAEPYSVKTNADSDLEYEWIEISSSGTRFTYFNNKDDASHILRLPWSFPYFGGRVSNFYVSSNGFIASSSYRATERIPRLPSTSAPYGVIAPYWVDLKFQSSRGSAFYYKSLRYDGVDAFVMQWKNMVYKSGSSDLATFQIILFRDGRIKMHIQSCKRDYSGVVGIGFEDRFGRMGRNLRNSMYRSGRLVENATIEINPLWELEGQTSGMIEAGETKSVHVVAIPSRLGMGPSNATLKIYSNDVNGHMLPHIIVPVNVTVTESTTTTTTTTPNANCPWRNGHSGHDLMLKCMDGSTCNAFQDLHDNNAGWRCCEERGGRAQCPRLFPHMCARENSCANGSAHCCASSAAECRSEGGLRGCEASDGVGRRLRGRVDLLV